MTKKPRRGRIYDPDLLWRVERQIDSANQHLSRALSMIRKELAKQEGRAYKPVTLEAEKPLGIRERVDFKKV